MRVTDADDLIAWERLRRETERRNAFGGVRTAVQRRDADQERAVRLAADNLLDKALRRIGDEDAARRLVDRALRLSVEGSTPGEDGALAVHLFAWDALREAALDGEHDGWLDRALGAELDEPARLELLAALRSLAQEGEIDQADRRRIRTVAGRSEDHAPFAGVEHEARVEATLQLLRALRDVVG